MEVTDFRTAICAILPRGIHHGDSDKRLERHALSYQRRYTVAIHASTSGFTQIKETQCLLSISRQGTTPSPVFFFLPRFRFYMNETCRFCYKIRSVDHPPLHCAADDCLVFQVSQWCTTSQATATFSSYGILPINSCF